MPGSITGLVIHQNHSGLPRTILACQNHSGLPRIILACQNHSGLPESFWFAPEPFWFAPKASCFASKEQSFIIVHNRLIIIKLDQSLSIKGPRVPKCPTDPKGPRIPKGVRRALQKIDLRAKGLKRAQRGLRYED